MKLSYKRINSPENKKGVGYIFRILKKNNAGKIIPFYIEDEKELNFNSLHKMFIYLTEHINKEL